MPRSAKGSPRISKTTSRNRKARRSKSINHSTGMKQSREAQTCPRTRTLSNSHWTRITKSPVTHSWLTWVITTKAACKKSHLIRACRTPTRAPTATCQRASNLMLSMFPLTLRTSLQTGPSPLPRAPTLRLQTKRARSSRRSLRIRHFVCPRSKN